MADEFTFHGQTTFINRPRDTVIRDFQNAYVGGDDSQAGQINRELAKLVATLLDSRDLSRSDKEDAVAAVHTVAEEVRDGKVSRLTLKGTLDAIKNVAGNAIDVGAQVATIVAAILQIAGIA